MKLGQQSGFHEDYDHINILTDPSAKKDGYRLAFEWIAEHDV